MEDFCLHILRGRKKKKSWFISNVLSVPKTTENVASYVHCTRGTHLTFWHFGLLKILDLAKIWSIKIIVHMHDAETQNI